MPKETLEEYYPTPFTKQKTEITNDKKVSYAKEVAGKITQTQFEADMKIIFDALCECNAKSFIPK
jgi:hypothetical protein